MPNTIVVAARLAADVFTVLFPPGTILPHGSTVVPTGYLLCDGSAVSRTTYAALFGAISTTWGVGDGSTTFNLPDCRGRTLFGQAPSGTFATLGSTGGSEATHTHTASHNHGTAAGHTHSFPNHTHVITTDGAHTHDEGAFNGGTSYWQGGGVLTSSAGAHNHGGATPSAGAGNTDPGFLFTGSTSPTVGSASTINPYVVSNYMIKV